MRRIRVCSLLIFALLFFTGGCIDDLSPHRDPQYLGLYYRYNFRDEVDTFKGTLTKDLVMDGTVTVSFWLTTEAQDSILAEAVRDSFFFMPDTILAETRIAIYPFPPPQVLRITAGNASHQLVWNDFPGGASISRLAGIIQNIIQSSPQYKNLPPARGGYM